MYKIRERNEKNCQKDVVGFDVGIDVYFGEIIMWRHLWHKTVSEWNVYHMLQWMQWYRLNYLLIMFY